MRSRINLGIRGDSPELWVCEKRLGTRLWNLLELPDGLESVFLNSGFQRLDISELELRVGRENALRISLSIYQIEVKADMAMENER